MSARTTRTRLFAATTVALAALALTACEGDGTDTGAAAPAASTASSTSAGSTAPSADQNKPSADGNGTAGDKGTGGTTGDKGTGGTTGDKGTGGTTGGAADSGGDTTTDKNTDTGSGTSTEGDTADDSGNDSDNDSDMPGDCSAKDVRITAQTLSRPLNHLLLTATNTGSKTCMLPEYPAARFGEAQSVPPVAESSKPQSLTGVAPGEAGYAGVILSAGDGSGENGYQAETLTIPFDDGSIATVALPSGGVYVDTALTVTYWQADMDLALGF